MKFIKLKENKAPATQFHPSFYYNNIDKLDNAGFILGKNIVVLDFDNDNSNENNIIEFIEKEYPTLTVKTNRGKHFYYRIPEKYTIKRNADLISCLGFQCDYLTGEKAYAVVKQKGKIRETNKPFNINNMALLPKELLPLKLGKKLSGMNTGDGRNNGLFAHLLAVRESYPEIDIKLLAKNINNNIFTKSMDKQELNNIIKSALKKDLNTNSKKELKYSNLYDLQEKELPPIIYYVENLISQGLTLICGSPKVGKSWLSLDMGISICEGRNFLGFKTRKCDVLYLALEDNENRLQTRTNIVLGNRKAPKGFHYSINCDDIENGLLDELENILKKEPNIKVIIVDTMQKIRSLYKGNNTYGQDYKEIGKIKSLADKHGISIILIHHLKKGFEGDVFDKVSGTNGITGTADTTIILNKENRNKEDTILSVVGRDVEYNQYVLRFNKNNCTWKLISTYEEREEEYEKDDYYNNPIIQLIRKHVTINKGTWKTTYIEMQSLLVQEYSDVIDTTINKTRLKNYIPLLKRFDNIIFYADPIPKGKKRIVVFKKVDFVENVEDYNTNSTKTTNSTKNIGGNV